MAEILVVKSKVAELIKSKNMMMSSSAADALSKVVEATVLKGIERCKANGRKTVKDYDF